MTHHEIETTAWRRYPWSANEYRIGAINSPGRHRLSDALEFQLQASTARKHLALMVLVSCRMEAACQTFAFADIGWEEPGLVFLLYTRMFWLIGPGKFS